MGIIYAINEKTYHLCNSPLNNYVFRTTMKLQQCMEGHEFYGCPDVEMEFHTTLVLLNASQICDTYGKGI